MNFSRSNIVRGLAAVVCVAAVVPFSSAQSATTQPDKKIRVAIYNDTGGGESGGKNVTKCLGVMPDGFETYVVDAQAIRDGKLAGADVLVQPGGSGSAQAKALQSEGRDVIKKFVKSGGGYVGICAGAYLATNDYPWSLGFLNAKVLDKKHWLRNQKEATLKWHFTDDGQKTLGVTEGQKEVIYHNGPILAPSTQPDMAAYTSLAVFDTEVVGKGGEAGLMTGATAIASGTFGDGHVVAIAPHPERSPGMDGVIRRAVQWAAGQK